MNPKRQTELFCDWLENYLNYERIPNREGFTLDTMRYMVNRLENPQIAVKSIHVAGSKGKGSVSMMLSQLLTRSGLRSGLYLSPHILDFTERITRAGTPFPDEVYGNAADRMVPRIESMIPENVPGKREPTWFELVTLFAFMVFDTASMQWTVIETGLGGRLDATNVIIPEATVFTPIELEHTEYLGDTLEKIAAEKAGIMKPGVPVFTSRQHPEVRIILEKRAKELSCPFFSMEDAVASIESSLSVTGQSIEVTYNTLPQGPVFHEPFRARLSMLNRIQGQNAALAVYVFRYLFPDSAHDVLAAGLFSSWLPGRFEVIATDPLVVLDGAHTVDSICQTLKTFDSLVHDTGELVFACAADKRVDVIAGEFGKRFSKITVTRPGDIKKSDIGHTAQAFQRTLKGCTDVELEANPDFYDVLSGAFGRARSTRKPLLVTGSFYLVAEAKKILERDFQDLKN